MRHTNEPTPPHLAERLISLGLPPGRIGESVLGDLHEDYLSVLSSGEDGDEKDTSHQSARSRRRALLKADLWYWGQLPILAGPFLLRRIFNRRLYGRLERSPASRNKDGGMLSGLSRDIRHGARSLLRDKTFTAVAVLTLAIGIGATSSIFSVVNAVLLRPLPYFESHRLVSLRDVKAPQYLNGIQVAMGHFPEWRDRAKSFDGISAYVSTKYTLSGRGDPVRIDAASVSAGVFTLLGIRPVLGRDLLPE